MSRLLVTLVVIASGANEFGVLMQNRESALLQGPPKNRGAMTFPGDDPFRHAIPVLTQMAAERNLTEKHFEILDLILAQVTDLNEQSITQHNADKASLQDSKNEIAQCNTNFHNGGLSQWETATLQKSGDHSDCRDTQLVKHGESTTKCGSYKTWVDTTPREFSCTTQLENFNFPAHFPDNTGVTFDGYDNMPSCKKQMAQWGQDFQAGEYLEANCTAAFNAFDAQVKTCHSQQQALESAACEHHAVSKEACRTLDFCYASEVADHGRRCAQVAANVQSRKTAAHSGDLIKCFVDVLKADSHDIQSCYGPATSNLSFWNISCPTAPARATCAIGAAPGTPEYESEHYSQKAWWGRVSNGRNSFPFIDMKEDIETCASPAVVCSHFECGEGYVEKGVPEQCNATGVCKQENCCDEEASCSDITCDAGWVKTSFTGCGAAQCDPVQCCEKQQSCEDISCPALHIKHHNGLCAGTVCMQSECCAVEAQCSDFQCGDDHVKSSVDGCNATSCSAEICCDRKAICAEHVCSGEWEKNPDVPDAQQCDAARCDNSMCCRKTTTTTTTVYTQVANHFCIKADQPSPKRFALTKAIQKLKVDHASGCAQCPDDGVTCDRDADGNLLPKTKWGCGVDPSIIDFYIINTSTQAEVLGTSKAGWSRDGLNSNSNSLEFESDLPRGNLSIGYGDATRSLDGNEGQTCINIFVVYK